MSNPTSQPRYPLPDFNTLPEDIRAKILEVQEKSDFVPNVCLAFARRPLCPTAPAASSLRRRFLMWLSMTLSFTSRKSLCQWSSSRARENTWLGRDISRRKTAAPRGPAPAQ